MSLGKKLPVVLYFYMGDLSQADAQAISDAFVGKAVQLRKVSDINDTRDMVERCEFVSGTVPNIYFVRKAENVATYGVLADPLGRDGSTPATASGSEIEDDALRTQLSMTSGQLAPSDAEIAAKALKQEVEQAVAKKAEPDLAPEDIKPDARAETPLNAVTAPVAAPAVASAPASAAVAVPSVAAAPVAAPTGKK